MSGQNDPSPETTLILNPNSGSGDHEGAVRDRAQLAGYAVKRTEGYGEAVTLTQEAIAEGATTVAAVGGDGTLNEVLRGVIAADALADVTLAVIPAGTGNDFANNIGITSIEEGFATLRSGERRRLDVGMANGAPFLNSCLAGLTAEASTNTPSELKSRYGVLAYVMTAFRVLSEFEGLELTAEVKEGTASAPVWTGSAAMVLAGNGRRFSMTGSEQANMEDGFLDVTIIQDASAADFVGEEARERLFGEAGDHFTRLVVSSMELSVESSEQATFSLDGEMEEFSSVTLSADRRAVRMPVGDGYTPTPETE